MSMTKIGGFGSISQGHGSADLDSDPLMDPQHWLVQSHSLLFLREKNIEMALWTADAYRAPSFQDARCTHHEDQDRCLAHHVEGAPGYRALLTQQMLEIWAVFCLRKSCIFFLLMLPPCLHWDQPLLIVAQRNRKLYILTTEAEVLPSLLLLISDCKWQKNSVPVLESKMYSGSNILDCSDQMQMQHLLELGTTFVLYLFFLLAAALTCV